MLGYLNYLKNKKKLKLELEIKTKELELEIKTKKLNVDKEINSYRQSFSKEIEELALGCAKDKAKYEHEYHSQMETLKVEIVKLEALKETMEHEVNTFKNLLLDRDKELERIYSLCTKLVETKNNIIVTPNVN